MFSTPVNHTIALRRAHGATVTFSMSTLNKTSYAFTHPPLPNIVLKYLRLLSSRLLEVLVWLEVWALTAFPT